MVVIYRVLKPHAETLFSYIRDTLSFLPVMDGLSSPPGSYLVTIDIECLYNSIPHARGLGIISTYMNQMDSDSAPFNKLILDLSIFVLSHNAFLFHGASLLQVQGVAMGTPCAHSYANLYLGGWEHTLLR